MSSIHTPKSLNLERIQARQQAPEVMLRAGPARAVVTIAGSATAVPPYVMTREIVKQHIGEVFSLDDQKL